MRRGKRRTYRPWIPEPGRWLQFDWGEGPRIDGRRTWLFCAWLSWSRFRVVIPVWDCTPGTLVACLDTALRRIGGAPTYVLTDNAKTVTVEHIAGIPVRHPQMVAAGRHCGCQVVSCSCVPYDPESKGGAEATVRIAKADLVPTDANLLPAYDTFAELADACLTWCDAVNSRRHLATGQIPADRLDIERTTLHVLPLDPLTLALGEERVVGSDRTISFNAVRYSTPPGCTGARVWCRVVGEEDCPSPLAPTPAICRKFGATSCRSQGFRRSSMRTTPTTPTAAASTNRDCSRARKRRSRSWASAREQAAGSRRPDPPARSVSAPRWPVPSSSPRSWAPTASIRLWGWPRPPDASPTATCSPSWSISRRTDPPASSYARTRRTPSRAARSAGRPWADRRRPQGS
ncbi:DDE-type integrase/transposase/recombinase [Streptomyces sp. RLB1-33]|nr:DDE-type integrase/transposase/recombinase [Streptomyces sp. RLB1-33]QIY74318.1 DDE-type integrase/transposase/recombinase [Streptomyces sp. RLB1-33]